MGAEWFLHVLLMGAVPGVSLGASCSQRDCVVNMSHLRHWWPSLEWQKAEHSTLYQPVIHRLFIYLFKDRLHFENRSKKKKKKKKKTSIKTPKMQKKKKAPTHLCNHHFLGFCRSEYCLSWALNTEPKCDVALILHTQEHQLSKQHHVCLSAYSCI